MNSLRLILIVVGVLFLAGLYLWELYRQKREEKRHSPVLYKHESALDGLKISPKPGQEEYLLDTIEELKQSGTKQTSVNPATETKTGTSSAIISDVEQGQLSLQDVAPSPTTEASIESAGEADTQTAFISLIIIPTEDKEFTGPEILAATKTVGMKFGAMNIFHHYGVGDLKTEKSIFSLANLFEPGEFDLQAMGEFSTRGLISYMCLPTPLEAEVCFELMLNTMQRIAEIISGQVLDDKHQPLDEDAIQAIRDKIRHLKNDEKTH